jgi:hypothetical protein
MDRMNVASEFLGKTLDEVKLALAGGNLVIYSVGRPANADLPVERSGILATLTFASPAFAAAEDGQEIPVFVENSVPAQGVGVPGFGRACTADGRVVADFSAGPGDREIKLAEISCSTGAPVRIACFTINTLGGWPERPDYYNTRPRSSYPMPRSL